MVSRILKIFWWGSSIFVMSLSLQIKCDGSDGTFTQAPSLVLASNGAWLPPSEDPLL